MSTRTMPFKIFAQDTSARGTLATLRCSMIRGVNREASYHVHDHGRKTYCTTSDGLPTKDDWLADTSYTVSGGILLRGREGTSGFDGPQSNPTAFASSNDWKPRSLCTTNHGDYYSQQPRVICLNEEMKWNDAVRSSKTRSIHHGPIHLLPT